MPEYTEAQLHERGLVGCLLADSGLIQELSHAIDSEMFGDLDMRKAFVGILNMHAAGVNLEDRNLVGDSLAKMGVSEDLCTLRSLLKLKNEAFPHNRHFHVAEIRKAWKRRKLESLGQEAQRRSTNTIDPDKDLAWLEAQLEFVLAGGSALQTRRAEVVADEVLAELTEVKEARPGVLSGIEDLDYTLGPVMPGELLIIAARPGGGKTSLAMQIAQHVATRGTVLFVSLEMKDRELIRRSLSALGGVNSRRLRESNITEDELGNLQNARHALTGLQLDICSPPRATISQICGLAKYHKAVAGLRMVVVDYIGLIQPAGEERRMERHLQVGQFTSSLKGMAKECEVPVVALAQLNRDAQNREPTMANLRESGSIEQDADIVLLIHHPEEGVAHIHIAKHRHGQTGVVRMLWSPETTSFVGNTTWTG